MEGISQNAHCKNSTWSVINNDLMIAVQRRDALARENEMRHVAIDRIVRDVDALKGFVRKV